MQTDYLYVSYIPELKDFLESLKDEAGLSVVDIADVHITPDIARILNEYTIKDSIRFRDTTNKDRDKILSYNYQVTCIVDEDTPIPFPQYDLADIKGFVKSLDKNKTYKVNDTREELLLAIFVSIVRPSILLDISSCVATLSEVLHTALFSLGIQRVIDTTNTFHYEYNGSWIQFTTDVKNLQEVFYVYGIGETTWSALCSDYSIIPSYFGVEDIRKDAKKFDVWKHVISYIQKGLQSCRQEEMTLLGYMKGDAKCLRN